MSLRLSARPQGANTPERQSDQPAASATEGLQAQSPGMRLNERDFVRALNVFGAIVLDVTSSNMARADSAVFGVGEMARFKAGVETFLKDPNSRATEGERQSLRQIALAFERSRGGKPSFGPANWADFLDFVQSKMPPEVEGFSDLAKDVRAANASDQKPDIFSEADIDRLNDYNRQALIGHREGRQFGADDWARFFLRLVVDDGSDPVPSDPRPVRPQADQVLTALKAP